MTPLETIIILIDTELTIVLAWLIITTSRAFKRKVAKYPREVERLLALDKDQQINNNK